MVHSAAGVRLPSVGMIRRAPFRAPHHSSSMVSLVGGGTSSLRPGEISLAHAGVLFLDELGEFSPMVLDGLRQPLEEGVIRVARARASATLPARFLLVAATNPCPCGGGPPGSCDCDDGARLRYLRRLSGPLLDRFDLRVGVARPGVDDLLQSGGGESTAVAAVRVATARGAAVDLRGTLNSAIPASHLDILAPLQPEAQVDVAQRARTRAADRSRLPPHPPSRQNDCRPRRRHVGAGGRGARRHGAAAPSQAARLGSRAGCMNTDLPPEAYAAALASFPHMSIHRLGALLRHHAPSRGVLRRRWRAPAGWVDRASPRRFRCPRRMATGRALLIARRGMGSLQSAGRPRAHAWDRRLPGAAPRRPAAAAGCVRQGRSRSARRASGGDRRHSQRHRSRPRHRNDARPSAGRCRRARRLRLGPWHRRMRSSSARCRLRAPVVRSRSSPRATTWCTHASTEICGLPSPTRACCCPKRHPALLPRPTDSRCAIG